MTRYTSIALALMAAIMLLAGCGSSKFKQGEKVWIALDGQTISKDGHAEGIVVGAKESLVQVQVSNIAANNKNDLLPSLRVGQATYIPTEQVYTVEKGQQRADQRRKLLEDLQEFFPKGTNPSPNEILEILQNKQNAIKRFSDLRDRAERAHVNEIAAAAGIAVAALKKAQAVMATTPEGKAKLRMDDKLAKRVVAAGPESFPQLKKTLKHYHFYDDFFKSFDAHPGNLDSIEQDLAKVDQQLLAFYQVEHGGEPISQWISVNPVAKILSAVSLGYIWASDTYMQGATAAKAAELKNMLKSSTAGEVALAEFSFGRKLDNDSVKDIKAHVKTALSDSIRSDIVTKATGIRGRIVEGSGGVTVVDANTPPFKSVSAAEAAYRASKKKVKPAENAFNTEILTKKDEQQYFVGPTKAALEKAQQKKEEKMEALEVAKMKSALVALVKDNSPHDGTLSGRQGHGSKKFIIHFGNNYNPVNNGFDGSMAWPAYQNCVIRIVGRVVQDGSKVGLKFSNWGGTATGHTCPWPNGDYSLSLEGGVLTGIRSAHTLIPDEQLPLRQYPVVRIDLKGAN